MGKIVRCLSGNTELQMSNKTPDWMPELVFCHRAEFCRLADQLGFRLGTRSDQFDTNRTQELLDGGFSIDFVDNDFENPSYDRLEEIVSRTAPKYVVLPDVYDIDDSTEVISFGEKMVDKYNATPVIVPKTSFDYTKIPDRWIIGFSVPSGYGETDIPITEFTHHRVHLLGGSHKNQIEYANKAVENGIDLFSVDGNAFAKGASYGNLVNVPSTALNDSGVLTGNAWDADVDGYTDWGQRIGQSLARYYELWRLWSIRSEYKS